MGNEKIIASFELSLIIISAFAFPYMIADNNDIFERVDAEYKKVVEGKTVVLDNLQPNRVNFEEIITLFKKLKEPMIPIVSAAPDDVGCCEYATDGFTRCATTSEAFCNIGTEEGYGFFANDTLCSNFAPCDRGCCYKTSTGVYDKNVLEKECDFEWDASDNCEIPGAELGCCIVGTTPYYNTRRQCEIINSMSGSGDVNWDGSLNDGECLLKLRTYKEGACLSNDGDCTFGTKDACPSGDFYEGYLCTHEDLDTWCEMTANTKCHNDKDGVYFIDTCGNFANVYENGKEDTQSYWNEVIEPKDSCGKDSTTGNADSETCGNCDRFIGGVCSSTALEDGIDVRLGNSYCRSTSCEYEEADGTITTYGAGDAWCDYDGMVGEGRDTVGSRHWKYSCDYGVVEVDPCEDYRNRVCIESGKIASCVKNNWVTCIGFNSDGDGLEKCRNTAGCRVDTVHVDTPGDKDEDGDEVEYFKFDVCVPEYPGGFDLTSPNQASKAKLNCGMASRSCRVIRKPKAFGSGCKYLANENCLSDEFAEEMNNMCRQLGDCGMEANYVGVISENYEVSWNNTDDVSTTIEPRISDGGYKTILKSFANSVNDHVVKIDYSKLLEASGFYDASVGDDYGSPDGSWAVPVGLGGLLASSAAYGVGLLLTEGTFTIGAGAAGAVWTMGITGVIAGVFLGGYVGFKIAELLGWNDVSGILLVGAGAALGAGASLSLTLLIMGGSNIWNPLGWGALIAAFLAALAWFISLFDDSCKEIKVSFECEPWKAPSGGDDCEKCNDDPLKPCSKYRCSSLGAACELKTDGDGPNVCVSGDDDLTPVLLSPQLGMISSDAEYVSIVRDKSFDLEPIGSEDCFEPWTDLIFGVKTNKLANCKYSMEMEGFDDMDNSFGVNGWFYNHTLLYHLPDLSGGESSGVDATRDLTLYVKCKDSFERESFEFYKINMCIKEGPDRTAPTFEAISPVDNDFVGLDTLKKDVTIVTNEPSNCRWDFGDVDYSNMANDMSCSRTYEFALGTTGYVCEGEFNTTNDDNTYYVRCMDQPWLNENYDKRNDRRLEYRLQKPDKKIEIVWIKPDEDIESGTSRTSIDLEVKTSDGGGDHLCQYSFSGYEVMIRMWPPKNSVHTQSGLSLSTGTHKIRINCSDETGDIVSGETEFTITYDDLNPKLVRVWQSGSLLHVITDEESECVYSDKNCNYGWNDEDVASAGNDEEHTINVIAGKTYYIKCRDKYDNGESYCLARVQAV